MAQHVAGFGFETDTWLVVFTELELSCTQSSARDELFQTDTFPSTIGGIIWRWGTSSKYFDFLDVRASQRPGNSLQPACHRGRVDDVPGGDLVHERFKSTYRRSQVAAFYLQYAFCPWAISPSREGVVCSRPRSRRGDLVGTIQPANFMPCIGQPISRTYRLGKSSTSPAPMYGGRRLVCSGCFIDGIQ